ncbi:DUF4129 domain-containing protein [Lacinutrix jangbogonensis]|uniref:DUF4129 domain-containing protein n=1 Tax=Lacinutrix jangbogonensis TaxID=1469557 RepID=UPI00053D1A69|nr:DUF4129 domain-containing protein [Lacinutrix jangbogonensis]
MHILRLLFLLFFVSNIGFSQDNTILDDNTAPYYQKQDISKDDLKKYSNKDAFNYQEEIADEDSAWAKFKRWVKSILIRLFSFLFGVDAATGILWFILRVLPFILLGVLVFLLIRFFLKVNSRNLMYGEQKKSKISFTDEEQIIKNEDINALITEAVKQKDYRLAIRYYYLLAIKELSENNIIDWEQQKTNEDYIKEIKANTLQTQFEKITRIYDYVWYGEFEVDAPKFENLKLDFMNLNKQVKN